MKSPYKDKNGKPLSAGDKITGSTNFDTVQALVYYNEQGEDSYEQWRIEIVRTLTNDKTFTHKIWKEANYSLYLAYHIDKNNQCIYYEKIDEFID